MGIGHKLVFLESGLSWTFPSAGTPFPHLIRDFWVTQDEPENLLLFSLGGRKPALAKSAGPLSDLESLRSLKGEDLQPCRDGGWPGGLTEG